MRKSTARTWLFIAAGCLASLLLWRLMRPAVTQNESVGIDQDDMSYESFDLAEDYHQYEKAVRALDYGDDQSIHHTDAPLIFVAGFPRSGTTLMRVILDSHPDVRCGEETRVIPDTLNMYRSMLNKNASELMDEGTTTEMFNEAMQAFIMEIIAHHGPEAKRMCNKDPMTMGFAVLLKKLFPKSKFVFMIRDGRANIASIIQRHVTIGSWNLNDPRHCLKKYSETVLKMLMECKAIGPESCYMQRYETLVIDPEPELRKLLAWLDMPWNDTVMHHEKHIGTDVTLSKLERSTDQVQKKIYLSALTNWTTFYQTWVDKPIRRGPHFEQPKPILEEMATLCPVLAPLGYDPNQNPPNYAEIMNLTELDWTTVEAEYKKARRPSILKKLEDVGAEIGGRLTEMRHNLPGRH